MNESAKTILQNVDFVSVNQPIDLSNCDREPIHVPGAIQPHGVLIALSSENFCIEQVSANTLDFLGLEPSQLLNKPLTEFISPQDLSQVQKSLIRTDLETNPLYVFSLHFAARETSFEAVAHRLGDLILLELERPMGGVELGTPDLHALRTTLHQLERTRSLQEFCDLTAQKVREISGFDRVMVYRFAPQDGTGTVIAEEKRDELEPYLGLRYPASDIPKQARALYVLNHIRLIGDVSYSPVKMLATDANAAPLDMSYCHLRSVSPIHLEYLKNMGVTASMSISIIKDGELWGLIACHHTTPKLLPYEMRSTCEFLGQVVSLQIKNKEALESANYLARLKSLSSRFLELMSRDDDLAEALVRYDLNLLDYIKATGAAVCVNQEIVLLGQTPSKAQIQELTKWLALTSQTDVFATESLSKAFPAALWYTDVASGVLAVQLSKRGSDFVLWFRPEVLQTVSWGGNPTKPAEIATDGSQRLSPRKSFAAWKETVEHCAEAWEPAELEAAEDLRRAILEVVLRRAGKLAGLNLELEKSNAELDAFAYVASHDLKEPLRGIHNYSAFLLEDYGDKLDAQGRAKLETLQKLTNRMESLIESLLVFSRVGRIDFALRDCDLNDVLQETLESLRARLEETGAQVRVPRPLPSVLCDRVRVGEVLANLIVNAVKYNDKPKSWVEVGFIKPEERSNLAVPQDASPRATIFYVRDNGIGIRERHFGSIFRIFKRLHGRDEFGGGTGAGLTIVKKIVERHGGSIWLESTPGEGTSFYFTLESP